MLRLLSFPRFRLGIAAKLGMAITAVALSSVIVSLISFANFDTVEETLDVIVDQSLPRIEQLNRLTEQADRLAALANRLATAQAGTEIAGVRSELLTAETDFKAIVAQTRDVLGEEAGLGDLDVLAGRFSATIQNLASVVDGRAGLVETRGAALERLASGLQSGFAELGPDTDVSAVVATLSVLLSGAGVGDRARVEEAEQAFDAGLGQLRAAAQGDPGLAAMVDVLEQAGAGRNGLLGLQSRILRASERVVAGVEEATGIARDMRGTASALVQAQQRAVVTQVDTAKTEVGLARQLLIVITVGALIGAVAVTILYVGRQVVGRLQALSRRMLALADGDIDQQIVQAGNDELTEMARALVVFRDNALEVRRKTEEIEQERRAGEEKRRDALREMADNFERSVGHVVRAVLDAAKQMRDLADAMRGSAKLNVERSTVVAEASASASGNANSVAAAAEELSAAIQEIASQVAHAQTISSVASERANTSSRQVEELREAADRIGEVVTMIRTIAAQTNLLALNATIEAARAGEAGKGFAVVAGEVKTLSTQTSRATEDIAGQIESIREAVERVVGAIQSVDSTIGDITSASAAIAAAVEQQTAATNEISRTVGMAASETALVSETITEVRDAATRNNQTAEEVRAAAETLAANADELSRRVESFVSGIRAA